MTTTTGEHDEQAKQTSGKAHPSDRCQVTVGPMPTSELIEYLEAKLAGKYGQLEPAEHKRISNRLKVTRKRPKTHNTGFYNPTQWKAVKTRRRQQQAAKRRNRR